MPVDCTQWLCMSVHDPEEQNNRGGGERVSLRNECEREGGREGGREG